MNTMIIDLQFCHLVGDYVLQSDFLATTKGHNLWHMFVHATLYTLPFYIVYGFCWQMMVVWICHIFIDIAKAKYGWINYVTDQILHIALLIIYCI